ncbi:dihydropteroate synthase [Methyloceanibacter marginalis]|uniref:dihydropteroate synthase n=1 Tax=Methyloceanibacter marginalis TaxID=1774971 RepID=A0A1E3WD16_9HYPH|nr:dihydropteroate synthase [Methyloceanibacter marginalis]ODS03709.1 dihydropteroate synthase [Methyloceanibacter marginalis]
MAEGKLYLRPIGFLYGPPAEAAIEDGLALPLAGGPIAFTAAVVIEGDPASSQRRLVSVEALEESRDAGLGAVLERVTAPRPPFAGLSLARPTLMGIVNVTPDSFSDGGLYDETEGAVTHAAELASEGAEIVDLGGESTRPGSDTVADDDELSRVVPVLEELKGSPAVISIDTRKSAVARAAAKAGARILNDVSALTYDPACLDVAAEEGLDVVLMHAQGVPKTMQDNPTYDDVVLEVFDYLEARIEACEAAGIGRARIAADPGLGFGKTLGHNLAVLANLSLFHGLGVPLLVGASRKRFIGGLGQNKDPKSREPGSHAAAIASAAQGVQILRVHDVAGSRQALAVWRASMFGTEN